VQRQGLYSETNLEAIGETMPDQRTQAEERAVANAVVTFPIALLKSKMKRTP
jgi:hypothetical protein